MTALHVAAQAGRTEMVRYLLAKGARTDIADAGGRKPLDLVGAGGRGGGAPAPAAGAPPAAGGGGRGGAAVAASAAEIRTLLENAAQK
jgi:hypothetical protein